MKLNVKAMAVSCGLLWGGAILTTGIVNAIRPAYGRQFLRLAASIYPGYKPSPSVGEIAIATAYGLADGAAAGALCALLYNHFAPEHELGTALEAMPSGGDAPERTAV